MEVMEKKRFNQDVAEEMNIHPNSLSNWLRQCRNFGKRVSSLIYLHDFSGFSFNSYGCLRSSHTVVVKTAKLSVAVRDFPLVSALFCVFVPEKRERDTTSRHFFMDTGNIRFYSEVGFVLFRKENLLQF